MSAGNATVTLLRHIPLRRDCTDPLHYQLSHGIRSLVLDGRLQPGDRLPVVAELAKLCGVSKGTAMQAVDELRRRQVLVAKRRSGIHVAQAQPYAVEVFFCSAATWQDALGDFLEQVLEGLKAGYADSARRFMVTFANGHELSAQGLYVAAVARGVDSMVFYRPDPGILSAAAEVAQRIPCVSLVRPLPDSRSTCVFFSVSPPVERILHAHLGAGVRSFAYVGQLRLLKEGGDGVYAPYAAMHGSMLNTLAAAGIELILCLSPEEPEPLGIDEAEDCLVRRAAALPDGCVVLAQTGTLAEKLARLGKGFRIVTYTEYGATLNACRGKATVLYGGLELLGKAAARTLKSAAENPADPRPRTVAVEPQVVA